MIIRSKARTFQSSSRIWLPLLVGRLRSLKDFNGASRALIVSGGEACEVAALDLEERRRNVNGRASTSG